MKALLFVLLAAGVPECGEVTSVECRCAPGDACIAGSCLTRWTHEGFEHLVALSGDATVCGLPHTDPDPAPAASQFAGDDAEHDTPHCPRCWRGQ